jgi:hypothetical protein
MAIQVMPADEDIRHPFDSFFIPRAVAVIVQRTKLRVLVEHYSGISLEVLLEERFMQ